MRPNSADVSLEYFTCNVVLCKQVDFTMRHPQMVALLSRLVVDKCGARQIVPLAQDA